MKELATREMAQVNDAYDFLEKLRATPTPSKFGNTQTESAADAPKRDDPRAGATTESGRRPESNPKHSYYPEPGIDGEAFTKDSEDEYDMTGRPVRSEQETFFKTVNSVANEHATEISLGLAYGKYRFWKAIFNSKPGQFIVLVILAGICWIFGSDYSAKIILATVITIILWIILTITLGVIGGTIATRKNPGGEHERTKVSLVPTLLIWVVVFLCLTFILNKSPEEVAPNTQPVTQETKPEQAPIPSTSTLPDPTVYDPATASPSDDSQVVEPSPASDSDQNGSLRAIPPQANANGAPAPAETTEKGFQACVRFSEPAYEDCMKPYR